MKRKTLFLTSISVLCAISALSLIFISHTTSYATEAPKNYISGGKISLDQTTFAEAGGTLTGKIEFSSTVVPDRYGVLQINYADADITGQDDHYLYFSIPTSNFSSPIFNVRPTSFSFFYQNKKYVHTFKKQSGEVLRLDYLFSNKVTLAPIAGVTLQDQLDDLTEKYPSGALQVTLAKGTYDGLTKSQDISRFYFFGEDKYQTIIATHYDDQSFPALNATSSCYFDSVSFVSDNALKNYVASVPHANAIYIANSQNASILFNNCSFASESQATLSAALAKNQLLKIMNCTFSNTNSGADGEDICSPILLANSAKNGNDNAVVFIENSSFWSKNGKFFRLFDANYGWSTAEKGNQGGEMSVTLINNAFSSDKYGSTTDGVEFIGPDPFYSQCLVGSIELGGESSGNNVTIFNAQNA